MIFKIILVLFLPLFLYSKNDYFYSFIDSNANLISEQKKQEIIDGFEVIESVKELKKEGRIDEGYEILKDFREKNTLKILESDLTLLYCELLLRKESKRYVFEGSSILEEAINSSKIYEDDLHKAYMLLVDLRINLNKIDDARFFANNIINNFDDPLIKAYGKIYLAKTYSIQRDYQKAIRILYEILTKTTDVTVATVVADELFDVYLLDEKKDKAYELISKVLHKNMDYYAGDNYLAMKKIDRLVKVGMPEFAILILEELINRAKKPDAIEDFKFRLADIYMQMYDRTPKYLELSKELYKDLLNDFPQGTYVKKVKMYLDEILMREGKVDPGVISTRYQDSASMQQKVLLQELFNYRKDKKYDLILKSKKVYKKISRQITKRFGYEDINEIFDEVNILMIKDLLAQSKCEELDRALKTARRDTLKMLIEDEETKFKYFSCLIEVPNIRAYEITKDAFNSSRDARIYYYLEKMAYSLDLLDDAIGFSKKVDMIKDTNILKTEFLDRFLVYYKKGNSIDMDKFFIYASKNPEYIESNKNDPRILDFYYQYYLYLLKVNENKNSENILEKLYKKQKEFRAKIYSPFVELELSEKAKARDDKVMAINYLNEAIMQTRRIKSADLAKIYYELSKLYTQTNKPQESLDAVNKCKELKNIDDNFYKKMCDKL